MEPLTREAIAATYPLPRRDLTRLMAIEDMKGALIKYPFLRALWLADGERKMPGLKGWGEKATSDIETLAAWARDPRFAGFAWACQFSGIYVLDIDVKNIHDSFRPGAAGIIRELKALSRGMWAQSSGGGWHFYFANPQGYGKVLISAFLKGDLRHVDPNMAASKIWIEGLGTGATHGRYVCAYKFGPDAPASISDPSQLAPIPAEWGLSEIVRSGRKPPKPGPQLGPDAAADIIGSLNAASGNRNDAINEACYKMAVQGGSDAQHASLAKASLALAPDERDKTVETLRNARKAGVEARMRNPVSAASLPGMPPPAAPEEAFLKLWPHGHLNWVSTSQSRENAGYWQLFGDRGFEVASANKITGRLFSQYADRQVRLNAEGIPRGLTQKEKTDSVRNALFRMRSELHGTTPADWDCDDRYLLDEAGTAINLEARNLEDMDAGPAECDMLISKRLSCRPFSKEAASESDFALDTIRQCMGSEELADYLLWSWGYSLNAKCQLDRIFVHQGRGNNGKSMLNDAFAKACGPLAVVESSRLLTEANKEPLERIAAKLLGIRYARLSEYSSSYPINEDIIKAVAGNAETQARFLHGEPFNVRLTATIHIESNQAIRMRDINQKPMRRRLRIIPWNMEFADNPSLKTRFDRPPVRAAVMRLALEQLAAYNHSGMEPYPEAVRNMTDGVFSVSMHPILRFIEECLIDTGSLSDELPIKDIRARYEVWGQSNRERSTERLSTHALGTRLAEVLPPERVKDEHGKRLLNMYRYPIIRGYRTSAEAENAADINEKLDAASDGLHILA